MSADGIGAPCGRLKDLTAGRGVTARAGRIEHSVREART